MSASHLHSDGRPLHHLSVSPASLYGRAPCFPGQLHARRTARCCCGRPCTTTRPTSQPTTSPLPTVPGISAQPVEDNLRYFNVIVEGPPGTVFERACWGVCVLGVCWASDCRGVRMEAGEQRECHACVPRRADNGAAFLLPLPP